VAQEDDIGQENSVLSENDIDEQNLEGTEAYHKVVNLSDHF